MFHTMVHRPWENYETVDLDDRHQVKRMMMKSGENPIAADGSAIGGVI